MAKTIPFPGGNQAARARQAKALLLPIPRSMAVELILPVHIALDAMRRGAGSRSAAQTLTQTMLLTGFLCDLGYGEMTYEQLRIADQALSVAFERGRTSDDWRLGDEHVELLAHIVSTYDAQLQRAPLSALTDASARLDRIIANGGGEPAMRRQA
ncbi:hypothetical protein H3V53_22490 [Paraburkholderia bengalensis]|uniref:Fis family transcriptional regulator n=1 Tax=Paraburkholderia bengalensis TaxID=2747562 RepID=A0ABU8IW98_9BURK